MRSSNHIPHYREMTGHSGHHVCPIVTVLAVRLLEQWRQYMTAEEASKVSELMVLTPRLA